MSKTTYGYTYEFSGEDEPTFCIDSVWTEPDEYDWLAEEVAEDYHANHDGWEDDWPVTFTIWKGDECLGKWSVDLEAVPSFSARAVPDKGRGEK